MGCDSIITLNLTVNQPTTSSLAATICAPASYNFNGQLLSTSGIYASTLSNAVGCDSIITLNLTVNQPTTSSLSATICAPASYNFNGQTLTNTGIYTSTLSNTAGCDSIITLDLTVNQPTTSSLAATICAPATYNFNGQILSTSGTYTSTLSNTAGCDSLITLNLTINQPTFTIITDTLCAPQQFTVGTQSFNSSGTYTIIITNTQGCDSTITLNLHIDEDSLYIIRQPQSRQLLQNDTAVFTVEAFGARDYQWQQKQGNHWMNLPEQYPFTGTQSPNLRFTALALLHNSQYRLQVSGCRGTIHSDSITLSVHPLSDSIHLTLPQNLACPGDTLRLPIKISDASQIGALHATFTYNPTVLQLLSYTAAPQSDISLIQQNGVVNIIRQAVHPLSINGDTLLNLLFVVVTQGVSSLHWQIPPPGTTGISTPAPQSLLHRVSYRSGTINAGGNRPLILTQPAPTQVTAGQLATISIQAQNVQAIRWQRHFQGSWMDLNNNGLYQGVGTDSLLILNVPDSLNQSQYRAVLLGTCPSSLTSDQVLLTVISNLSPPILRIDSLGIS